MKEESYELFKSENIETIVTVIENELKTRNESPFWVDKVVPFTRAILSVLLPLRENHLLFDAQGNGVATLTPELFLEWSDFVSLKTLAFTLQKSNAQKRLCRTRLSDDAAERYKEIDLELLGAYLSSYSVNLENESLDFPIANYNLHQGVSSVIQSLL